MGALEHGLPSVLTPLGADQPHNARRAADLGVATSLDAAAVTPAEIEHAVTAMLGDARARETALELKAEIDALPPVEATVPLLERLAGHYAGRMAQRLVHIVDEVPGLDDGEPRLADAGARPRRLPRRRQRRGPRGPAPRRPVRRPGRGHVRRRRAPRLPRPAARRCRSCATTTSPTTRPGWSSACSSDAGGTPYLLLHGPEPDTRWEAFCAAVREVVERFGVTRVVGMGAVPMAVPHTRPIAITQHANNVELIAGDSPWRGELRIPSSAQALLEVRLGEWGHDAMGFVAHIPHYLAQLEYPRASAALLEHVERGRPADHRPLGAARRGRGARGRDHPLPRRQRGGRRGRHGARAAVRRVHPRRGERQQPAGRRPAAADRRGDRPAVRAVPRRARPAGQPERQPEGRPRMPASADELVELLDIERLDVDLFRGRQPETDRQRVFGGQVAAQALIAGDPHGRRGPSRALAALLLPAAGRHGGADHLRRRADPRRPLVRDPADRRRASTATRSTS